MSALHSTIKVILADKQQLFRLGFERLLESHPDIDLLTAASSGNHVLALVRNHRPDVIVTERELDDMGGEELVKKIATSYPGIGIVVLTMESSRFSITNMLGEGAIGYALKTAEGKEIIEVIRAAARGEERYCRTVAEIVRTLKISRLGEFNAVELRIIAMIAAGDDTKTISNTLRVTIESVKKHRKTIFQKADVNNVMELIAWAGENGVV